MKSSLLVATPLLLAFPACPPSPAPPVSPPEVTTSDAALDVAAAPDAGGDPVLVVDAADLELGRAVAACANLKKLGCPEGADPMCAVTMAKASKQGLTDLHPACLTSASSKEQARACKSVRCP